jgi:hypothetical protein
MENMSAIISCLRIIFAIIIITTATSTILEIGIINMSYAQVTPNQNPLCDPSDTHVNTTESRVCGVPKTPSATTAASITTGLPSSISPSEPPLEPIPGILPITTTNSTK